MANRKESAHFSGGKKQAATTPGGTSKGNASSAFYEEAAETALLRGLIHSPARRVLELAEQFEVADLFHEPHRTLYTATVTAAKRLTDAGDEDAFMSPARVNMDLYAAGELTEDVKRVLLDVTSSAFHPAAWSDVEGIARHLKENRARRAVNLTGQSLQDASHGNRDDLVAELGRLVPAMVDVCHRAGMRPDFEVRKRQAALRYEGALRCEPLEDGRRDPAGMQSDAPIRGWVR